MGAPPLIKIMKTPRAPPLPCRMGAVHCGERPMLCVGDVLIAAPDARGTPLANDYVIGVVSGEDLDKKLSVRYEQQPWQPKQCDALVHRSAVKIATWERDRSGVDFIISVESDISDIVQPLLGDGYAEFLQELPARAKKLCSASVVMAKRRRTIDLESEALTPAAAPLLGVRVAERQQARLAEVKSELVDTQDDMQLVVLQNDIHKTEIDELRELALKHGASHKEIEEIKIRHQRKATKSTSVAPAVVPALTTRGTDSRPSRSLVAPSPAATIHAREDFPSPATAPFASKHDCELPIHPRAPGGHKAHLKSAGHDLPHATLQAVRKQLQSVNHAERRGELVTGKFQTRVAIRPDERDLGTWFMEFKPAAGPLSGGRFLAWLRFPADFPGNAPTFAMLTPLSLFTKESTGTGGSGSVCLELTYEHTRNASSRWKSVWGGLLQSGMVAWLLQLANGIDEASVEPGEFANVRRDKKLEKATGAADTIRMTSEEVAEACRRDAHASAAANASPELRPVAKLFD